jgi:hypothetical protein
MAEAEQPQTPAPLSGLASRIAEVDDLVERLVPVPEWGVDLLYRTPTLRRRFQYLAWRDKIEAEGGPALERQWVGAIIAVACDPATGDYVFDWADIDVLASKHGPLVERLAVEAFEVMALTKQAADRGKDSSSSARTSNTRSRSRSGSAARSGSSKTA